MNPSGRTEGAGRAGDYQKRSAPRNVKENVMGLFANLFNRTLEEPSALDDMTADRDGWYEATQRALAENDELRADVAISNAQRDGLKAQLAEAEAALKAARKVKKS